MKRWSVCLFLAVLLLAAGRNVINAETLPLQLHIYEYNENEVLVQLVATEPLVLNAFTVEIVYDIQIYELHKWNDEVPKGYGYVGSFKQQYEKSGTLVLNDTPGTVVLSGVNMGKSAEISAGAFAQVMLICYGSEEGDKEIALRIRALNIDGKSALEEEEITISGEKKEDIPRLLPMDVVEKELAETEDASFKEPAQNKEPESETVVAASASGLEESDSGHSNLDKAVSEASVNEGGKMQENESVESEMKIGEREAALDSSRPDRTTDQTAIWLLLLAVVSVSVLALVACVRRKRRLQSNDSVD